MVAGWFSQPKKLDLPYKMTSSSSVKSLVFWNFSFRFFIAICWSSSVYLLKLIRIFPFIRGSNFRGQLSIKWHETPRACRNGDDSVFIWILRHFNYHTLLLYSISKSLSEHFNKFLFFVKSLCTNINKINVQNLCKLIVFVSSNTRIKEPQKFSLYIYCCCLSKLRMIVVKYIDILNTVEWNFSSQIRLFVYILVVTSVSFHVWVVYYK